MNYSIKNSFYLEINYSSKREQLKMLIFILIGFGSILKIIIILLIVLKLYFKFLFHSQYHFPYFLVDSLNFVFKSKIVPH